MHGMLAMILHRENTVVQVTILQEYIQLKTVTRDVITGKS